MPRPSLKCRGVKAIRYSVNRASIGNHYPLLIITVKSLIIIIIIIIIIKTGSFIIFKNDFGFWKKKSIKEVFQF